MIKASNMLVLLIKAFLLFIFSTYHNQERPVAMFMHRVWFIELCVLGGWIWLQEVGVASVNDVLKLIEVCKAAILATHCRYVHVLYSSSLSHPSSSSSSSSFSSSSSSSPFIHFCSCSFSHRTSGTTSANQNSSHSHAVFIVRKRWVQSATCGSLWVVLEEEIEGWIPLPLAT